MTYSEILENNLLIAEFMNNWTDTGQEPAYYVYKHKGCSIHELEFHNSYDWIMPVIEKIENTVINGIQLSTNIEDQACFILGTSIFAEAETKLEAIWLTVIKFIKWYNNNK